MRKTHHQTTMVQPGQFEPENHYYPRVLNAQLHPLVAGFLSLGNSRIAERYCHLHPEVSRESVEEALSKQMKYMRWSGADLFCVTNDRGNRRVVVIETNSCPSGQKSMPMIRDMDEQNGYKLLLERAFVPALKRRSLPEGGLAVLYDKNHMEASAYAATLADLTNKPVHLVPFLADDENPPARFTPEGVLEIRTEAGMWQPIRAALRYVTQRPWTRIPPLTKTLIFNPVIGCLAGGRNKLLASKAYDFYNGSMHATRLAIRTPETIWDVTRESIPMWVQRMGGIAVVKNPYSNAGQGVWTIVNNRELQNFMDLEQRYDRFIVQSLIGNSGWSSRGRESLYHLGTVPDKKGRIFVADLRFMVGSGDQGFFPVAIYARRSPKPLIGVLEGSEDSWDMLGTNLSYRDEEGQWKTQTERLLLMDNRDFNRLGIGLDDLIESYLQTVMATTAIDRMADSLVSSKGKFKYRFFGTVNPDNRLADEICRLHT
ncbi:hypothetical protein SCOR_04085 [Sulfidibacter corallicola]|uniref:ATP-grasp domain-containing protein n=1 Tax=Sulfidibacter corallicola TaxID=2818388 RepID=A0A8A4TSK9_SULCO|nr:hypothetical protein [Sulfidibacter corallicola]QTD52042.1 hypothetical protein J3U87_06175 [Sulfidibacter corallicola]